MRYEFLTFLLLILVKMLFDPYLERGYPAPDLNLVFLTLAGTFFSQSLLVFFLCISRAQTMHLERQSLKLTILFIH